MTNNPIELLIALAVNNGQSKKNIDDNIQALKKHYDRNPLLLNVDFSKDKAFNNLQGMINNLNKQKIEIDVDFKNTDGIGKLKGQAKEAAREFEQLNRIINQGQSGSSKSFDLDLDRVLIQLDNLGRKGIIASNQLDVFRNSIERLRSTNDRLGLKEIVTDMFNVTSTTGHADRVMEQLNQSLIKVGQSQQKLTSIGEKFNIDKSTNDEYIRLANNVEKLTSDIIRMQSAASTGGADELQLAKQIRTVEERLKEARRDLDAFNTTAKSASDFDQLVNKATRLHQELYKAGNVSSEDLNKFQQEIAEIGASSTSSSAKLTQLTAAMNRMKDQSKGIKIDNRFEDQSLRYVTLLEKLEAKLIRIRQIHKSTADQVHASSLSTEINDLRNQFQNLNDPSQARGMIQQYRELTGEVDRLGASATTAARASQGLGGAMRTALEKFPIWLAASSMIYAPIRAIEDLTAKVVELDSVLINLQRVDLY